MNQEKFNEVTGVWTAIITPFKNNKIDYPAFEKIIERQINAGINGIVVYGSTGEAATLEREEKKELLKFALEKVNSRIPILAGTGTNNTQESIELSKDAEHLGVDGLLVVAPYYNKPTQEGLLFHYKKIAESTSIPICLYNVPGRSIIKISPTTLNHLSEIKNITSLKEADADMTTVSSVMNKIGNKLSVISGDDFTFLPFLSLGGKGVISVLTNVAPKAFVQVYDYVKNNKWEDARELFFKLEPLMQLLFKETNPMVPKAMLKTLGYCESEARLPLTEASHDTYKEIETFLKTNPDLEIS